MVSTYKFMQKNYEVHDHDTRRQKDFYRIARGRVYTGKSIFYSGVTEYNKLDGKIKESDSVGQFRKLLTEKLKCKYKER